MNLTHDAMLVIRTEWEAITGALLASTALTLVVTATVFRLFARRQARGAR